MAENKKSFLLYCDLIHTIDKLPNDKAGELFKHILNYVNDNSPTTEDLIIQITFEPIKQQLKRDLLKYNKLCNKNRDNAHKRWGTKNTTAYERIPNDTKHTDSDTDNVIVKDIITINNRLAEFKNSLHKFKDDYNSNTLKDFYLYWTEKKPKGKKMLFEMQKTFDISRRLARWKKNNFNKTPKKEKKDAAEILQERYNLK